MDDQKEKKEDSGQKTQAHEGKNESGNSEKKTEAVEGFSNTATPLLDRQEKIAERMEKANEEKAALLDRQERMLVEARAAGRSFATGSEPTKYDKAAEFFKGTGIDEAIKKYAKKTA